jgi:protein-S-isoprenylcysteine O-methyltransferase Ste14
MAITHKIVNMVYSITTGNTMRKTILTPFVGSAFAIMTSLYIIVPLYLDKIFGIPKIPPYPINYILSLPLAAVGIVLMVWSNLYYIKEKGTPVPVNPPQRLITGGPFVYSRNPMHSGLFLLLFGFGIYYGSMLAVLVFIPIYILIDVTMLKKIEEPELEKRLGEEYIEYKKRTPMFLGWRVKDK